MQVFEYWLNNRLTVIDLLKGLDNNNNNIRYRTFIKILAHIGSLLANQANLYY